MSIYVIVSSDEFLLEEEKKELIKSKNIDSFNISTYNFNDSNPLEILSEMTTISLLGEERMVVITNPEFLKPTYKNTDVVKKIIDYFKNPNDDTILLILSDFSLSENLEITQVLKAAGDIKVKEAITGDNLTSWIKNLVEFNGYKIDDFAISELIERTNGDTMTINSELKKLMLYQDDKNISVKTVKLLVSKSLEDNIYNFISAFLARDTKKLLSIYDDFMTLNEDEMRIIASISSKLEEILYTKVLMKQGLSKDQIAGYFKVKPGRAYYMMEAARKMNDHSLNDLINRITELDFKIKTGAIDKKLGLQLFILGV